MVLASRFGPMAWRVTIFAAASVMAAVAVDARADSAPRRFADRPVAWWEHDDAPIAAMPARNDIEDLRVTLAVRDSLPNEVDRLLALEGPLPALDVNAADEVPCSTWFCPRNHLHPLSADEIARGPGGVPPRPPLTIVEGKEEGQSPGFVVRDADGRRFLVKFDPPGHLGMATGAEIVGSLVFHAAGYNVPGAFLIDVGPGDLRVDANATRKVFEVERRPLTEPWVFETLGPLPRLPDGRWRAVAVPWLSGQILGAFDMQGRRWGDPNDLIPHERRRSLRASWVPFAWLSVLDAGAINTLDTVVDEGPGRHARHYFIDFNAAFGSSTDKPQGLHQDGEYVIEVGRTLAALGSLGLYRRPFLRRRGEYEGLVFRYPAVGYYPDTFDPDQYRQNRKNPAFVRMTDRDAYWGAKVVTAFSDDQIGAIVRAARLPAADAGYLEHAMISRRDIIGRRYLRTVAAVERPAPADDGTSLCFDDLAIVRGYAAPATTRYRVRVLDAAGVQLAAEELPSAGSRTCVGLGPSIDAPQGWYRVVEVRTLFEEGMVSQVPARASKAARVHLQLRAVERHPRVVGLEREE
jgi:hypothetical protein